MVEVCTTDTRFNKSHFLIFNSAKGKRPFKDLPTQGNLWHVSQIDTQKKSNLTTCQFFPSFM